MDSHVGYLIKAINDRIKVKADKDLKSRHLTLAQSRVLMFLRDQGGQATQKEIETFLEVSHPTVVGLVSRMARRKFVNVTVSPRDRRNRIISLTDDARAVSQDMDTVIRAMEERMLAKLSLAERTTLMALLERVNEDFA